MGTAIKDKKQILKDYKKGMYFAELNTVWTQKNSHKTPRSVTLSKVVEIWLPPPLKYKFIAIFTHFLVHKDIPFSLTRIISSYLEVLTYWDKIEQQGVL